MDFQVHFLISRPSDTDNYIELVNNIEDKTLTPTTIHQFRPWSKKKQFENAFRHFK